MKRFLALLLIFVTVLSVISCNDTISGGNDAASTGEGTDGVTQTSYTQSSTAQTTVSTTAEQSTTQNTTDIPTESDDPFYVGYAKENITPDVFPIHMYSDYYAEAAGDELCATVVAFSDAETTVLMISVDLITVTDLLLYRVTRIAGEFGIPAENVMLCATHTHSGVAYNYEETDPAMLAWRSKFSHAVRSGIEKALDDLSPADAYIGTADTEGFAFVRRYIMEDGSYRSIQMPSTTLKYASHESEADSTLQAIRFAREGAKDVVIANWQAHPAHAVGMFDTIITSDFVGMLRTGAEREYGVNFAYYQGACGNINLTSYISGKQIYKNYAQVGNALIGKLGEAIEDMTPVNTGKINIQKEFFVAEVDHSTDRFIDHARKAYEAYQAGEINNWDEMYKRFGFFSRYHASAIISRYGKPKTERLPISAISFGELAFASTPYEMFDTNAMQIKDASPFKMTFVCSCTNGGFGYVPSTAAYDHGGYEVYSTKYVKGTGDAVAARLIEILKTQYEMKEE